MSHGKGYVPLIELIQLFGSVLVLHLLASNKRGVGQTLEKFKTFRGHVSGTFQISSNWEFWISAIMHGLLLLLGLNVHSNDYIVVQYR